MEDLFIREVWASNLEKEFDFIRHIVDKYPFVAMDTEFPGVVLRASPGNFKSSAEYKYKSLQVNVDALKLIQLGLTFSDEKGNLPSLEGSNCVWQFNFRDFDWEADAYAEESIHLLRKSGINFSSFKQNGIDSTRFAELLMSSGVVLNENVLWITFHSCYDFAYLLKVLTHVSLPSDEDGFFSLLRIFFPVVIDIKYLMRFCACPRSGRLHGGLERLAEHLGVQRIGPSHQAGSDSLLTSRVFWALLEKDVMKVEDIKQHQGVVYGLGVAADEVDPQAVTK